ncbi:MAG: type II toxin-antitoxin system RelE/ParE family toxin [Pirellulaceae bacterium]
MEISFSNKKLAKVCNSGKEMQAKHGKRMAEKLQQRLAELRGAETLADMRAFPAARCHELTGNLSGMLAVDLVHPDRLVFSPDHNPIPKLPDGGLDWSNVTRILIEGIGDYHG